MLMPLIRLLVAHGVTYPRFVAALKPAFLRAAHTELSDSGKRISDSALSIMSGVHRKDVRALMADERPRANGQRALSLADEVIARWMKDPRYTTRDGLPLDLPVRTSNGAQDKPSFDALMQSVSRDFHSRAALDELTRLGVVEVVNDVARLTIDRAVADRSFIAAISYVGSAVHDQLSTIEQEIRALRINEPKQ